MIRGSCPRDQKRLHRPHPKTITILNYGPEVTGTAWVYPIHFSQLALEENVEVKPLQVRRQDVYSALSSPTCRFRSPASMCACPCARMAARVFGRVRDLDRVLTLGDDCAPDDAEDELTPPVGARDVVLPLSVGGCCEPVRRHRCLHLTDLYVLGDRQPGAQ